MKNDQFFMQFGLSFEIAWLFQGLNATAKIRTNQPLRQNEPVRPYMKHTVVQDIPKQRSLLLNN